MGLTHLWIWDCDICKSRSPAEEQSDIPIGNVLLEQHLPYGWNNIDGKMVCPKHKIAIDPPNAEEPDTKKYRWDTDSPGRLYGCARGPIAKTWTDNKAKPPAGWYDEKQC